MMANDQLLVAMSATHTEPREQHGGRQRLPEHCVRRTPPSPELHQLARLLRARGLHSVCEEARCPNRSECWKKRAVTFMLLGSICTRACRFCAVKTGAPVAPPNPQEALSIAAAVEELALRHVVLTSVNRDDLPDGGAAHFARVLRAIHERVPGTVTEVLTPDFQGNVSAVDTVCAAQPAVFNHNVETVPRLYRAVRPGARFARSLAVLEAARSALPKSRVKSGLMLGLGETALEVQEVLTGLRAVGVDCLTLGQYLQPTKQQRAVSRYLAPEEFSAWEEIARDMGFVQVASGPLVRSSFMAEEQYQGDSSGDDL